MAGNKITTKTKGKDEKTKSNKVQTSEENEDLDFSLLRKPILTSVTGFAQARKIFELATEELKGLISNECDLLYECKVCRNIFRSLANFISHKRVYCKDEFNSSLHGQFFKMASTANEMLRIKRLEERYFESLKNKEDLEIINIDEVDNRIPLTKDLSAIIEKIAASKGVRDNSDPQLVLQKIPSSSVAVYQNVNNTDEKPDRMRNQVKELDKILSQDKAILQNDGKFKIQSFLPCESDNVIQISDDEDNNDSENLKCKICNQNFSTLKTLKFHMKYKHLESRLVYPCPDCLEIFSTSWSVYRHLFKVHRKTAAQIRRLRESIQAKAFKMNNPPAFYEKRKNIKQPIQRISEEERLDQENQAWMDNVEGDGDVPRCFGCGRTFERRAALAAHTHTCQPRSRALARRPQETKKIEIQIRKDYNKGPIANMSLPLKTTDSNENKISNEEAHNSKNANESDSKETEKPSESANLEEMSIDITDSSNKHSTTSDKAKENLSTYEKPKENQSQQLTKSIMKLPFSQHTEKSNLSAFRQKIQPDIEVNKLLCKKCDIRHDTVQELYHHMAVHFKWMRYACKLCNFKHYDFEKLPEHVKVVHKLRGDSDFYFSTVKAIDGNEALELSECLDEATETNDASPESRRPSRCSSDSSRLSDDSSSSSTRAEPGPRKRKLCQNKSLSKRKRETLNNDDDEDQKTPEDDKFTTDNDNSQISKTFEENSSDVDDIDDKASKRSSIDVSMPVASRRPVRKKTKLKNEDFEYDLSNLLKMEAQGYRDSQTITPKTTQGKKKITQDNTNYYEILNKDCSGALCTLSKMAVENFTAHLKNQSFIQYSTQKDPRPCSIFVRPMLPKNVSRGDKNSPKKELSDETIDNPSPQKEITINKVNSEDLTTTSNEIISEDTPKTSQKEFQACSSETTESSEKDQSVSSSNSVTPHLNMPAVLPIKLRRQSLDVIKKNPLINKNITDFKKAGMKTKILVIKPIHRNKDGTTGSNTPLKFQTIKLKDPSKSSSSKEENSSDQVVLVEVPKVDCVNQRVLPDTNTVSQTIIDTNVSNIDRALALSNCNSKTLNNNFSDDNIEKEITTETDVNEAKSKEGNNTCNIVDSSENELAIDNSKTSQSFEDNLSNKLTEDNSDEIIT